MGHSFKLVVLESPYDHWDEPFVRDLFHKTVSLKIKGYRHEYPYGILPVDTTDFVCTHHILCEDRGGVLEPIMAYRSITLTKCEAHKMNFPILTLMKSLRFNEHAEAIETVIAQCRASQRSLSYDSSWTIDPGIRSDRELTQKVRSIMTGFHSLFHHHEQTDDIISVGSLRFKMEKLFYYWGYKDISLNRQPLPSFTLPSYFDEPVRMFHQRGGFSKESLEEANQHVSLWDSRLEIRINNKTKKQAA